MIRVLLFDIGGVLVNWDGIAPLLELTKGQFTPEAARKFWLESLWVRKFEAGRCTPDEFANGAVAELQLTLPPQEFLDRFITWDRGPLPGAVELLAELSPRFFLTCLSNNNELHWRKLHEHPGLLNHFHKTFVSFEIGHVKPDPEVFSCVLSQLQFAPSEILFFDDNIECLETARQFNLQTAHVQGVPAVRATLKKLGLLAAQ